MINEYVKLVGEIEMRYEIETGDWSPMGSRSTACSLQYPPLSVLALKSADPDGRV